jgi:hypothetical protein
VIFDLNISSLENEQVDTDMAHLFAIEFGRRKNHHRAFGMAEVGGPAYSGRKFRRGPDPFATEFKGKPLGAPS